MKNYRITIVFNDPFPKESVSTETAGNLATAVARALRSWRKAFKGRRVKELSIKIITI